MTEKGGTSGRASQVRVRAKREGSDLPTCRRESVLSLHVHGQQFQSVFIPTFSFEVCEMVARQQYSETTSPG